MRLRVFGKRSIACLLVALAPGGVGVADDSPWIYGIHWYSDPADDDVEVMTGGKGIWVLETILTEDTGIWSLDAHMEKLETARARGHTIVIRPQPRWSLVVPGPNTPETAVGDRMETFIPKIIDMAEELADITHIWQIGNEMNLGFEYNIGNLTPQLYVDKYVEIRDAIKSVPSSLGEQVVLLGPVAPVDNAYLGSMLDDIIANEIEFDGFAMHAYGGARGNLMVDIDVQADFIDGKGFTDKPIYITEWGAPVDPISDTNEAATAQLLHQSFVNMANRNANPQEHPIVCAIWFIYRVDAFWQNWSILGLHGLHPPGINNDLYDAYQYACTLDLPAGDDFGVGGGSTTDPFISRAPSVLNPEATEGQDAPDDTFTVRNTGIGTLTYAITDDAAWLSTSPAGGASTGEIDTITVDYQTSGLSAGSYSATITISDPAAANNPQTISVSLTVDSGVADPTIVNPDFEGNGGGWGGAAVGWSTFGGNKWEGVWNPQQVWVQGLSEVPPNGEVGIYQQVAVTSGASYRVAVDGQTQTANLPVSIGAAPNGSTNPADATFGTATTAGSWTEVSHEFTATASTVTVFLKADNVTGGWIASQWGFFDHVTIEATGGGGPVPAINRSPATLSPSTTQGGSPPAGSFTVSNSGTGTLNYSITDNVAWLSTSPASGDSTGEADTITVNYSTASLGVGTHNATITISDPNASNNPQTIAVTLTVNSAGGATVAEDFDGVPSWTSEWNATWGGQASWSAAGGGQAGNHLQATRSNDGSSSKVKVYTLNTNTSYTVSIWMKGASSSTAYWVECAYRLGSHSAQNFDESSGSWTMIQKFSNTGTNGNGDAWTKYSKTFNSGSNTQISVGFKTGKSGGAGPVARWDTLRVEP